MTLEFNRMLKKCVSVTLNQVLNLIQDLTISGSRKIPILLDAEIVRSLRTVTPAEAGVQIFDFRWIPAYAGMTKIWKIT